MSHTYLAVAGAAAVAALLLVGKRKHVLALFVVGPLFVTNAVLWKSAGENPDFTGISRSTPVVATFTVCVVGVFAWAALTRRGPMHLRLILPFLSYLTFMYLFVWHHDPSVNAGMLHLIVGAIALPAGCAIAASTNTEKSRQIFFGWLAAALVFEAVIGLLQFSGSTIFINPHLLETDPTLAGRATGTFFHPSTLGKLAFLAGMLALPLTVANAGRLRTTAWVTLIAAGTSCIVTGGRANALALASMCLLWALLGRGSRRWAVRITIIGGAVLAVFISLPYWQFREETGEDGTFRAHFTQVALDYLHNHSWWAGVAPNRYIAAVGPYDSLTASGWPVHNVFLLTTVELGLLGCVLWSALFLVPAAGGIRRMRLDGERGGYARVLVAALPGLIFIATTGWGMLSDTLAAWMFVTGFCWWKSMHADSGQNDPAAVIEQSASERDAPVPTART